jgi:hypothetical protein
MAACTNEIIRWLKHLDVYQKGELKMKTKWFAMFTICLLSGFCGPVFGLFAAISYDEGKS